jgi:predicted dehydrogenase
MITRRDLLVRSATVGAAMVAPGVFASTQDRPTLRVGLIGCGGRGSGAARDAFEADPSTVLWAMGDVFADHVESSQKALKEGLGARFEVTSDRTFVGWDAYKGVIDSGCDIVILTTPPGFRPKHLRAAVETGKHVFMEKPVAVDAAGVRSVIESAAMADAKGLNIVAGTQRRHDVAYRQTMGRIRDGAMGEIVAGYAYWNQGGLWMNPRQEGWSDVEWQLRNWLYFTYLSGDHIVEQHIHNMDVCNWALGRHPVKAVSLAGRQVRTDAAYGHVFDHFATEYEYEGGAKVVSMCRQIDGCANRVSEHLVGTKGTSNANTWIQGEGAWRFEGDRPNPYVEEHRHLIAAIKSGNRINEGVQVAESTMTAILGRMAAYTGQEVTWEQAMASAESLVPDEMSFGPMAVAPVAVPGQTALS